jgi:hypothetical protein
LSHINNLKDSKNSGKIPEIFWNWRNPKKVFGAHYKIILKLLKIRLCSRKSGKNVQKKPE